MVCVRHVLEGHIVFQFNCTNTVKEQVLEDVSVTMDLADAVRRGGGAGAVPKFGWAGAGGCGHGFL